MFSQMVFVTITPKFIILNHGGPWQVGRQGSNALARVTYTETLSKAGLADEEGSLVNGPRLL